MKNFWKDLNSIQKTQAAAVAFIAIFVLIVAVGTSAIAPRNSRPRSQVQTANPQNSMPIPAAPIAAREGRPVPPTAVVDGVTYTGEQQVEALTQASRDAGMDEATARRTGEEAAALCNGNPDCLHQEKVKVLLLYVRYLHPCFLSRAL